MIKSGLLFFVVLYGIHYIYVCNDVKYIQSDIDQKRYVVLNEKDAKEAANMLATISKQLITVKTYLEKNHPDQPMTINIKNRFDPSVISEGSPDSQYTSYTVNKGEKMVFCIRDAKSKRVHDLNLLMYVSLHELAHVGCESIGHNAEFKRNFKFLLEIAEKINLYKPLPLGKQQIDYCGEKI
jgi:hypothetical protein